MNFDGTSIEETPHSSLLNQHECTDAQVKCYMWSKHRKIWLMKRMEKRDFILFKWTEPHNFICELMKCEICMRSKRNSSSFVWHDGCGSDRVPRLVEAVPRTMPNKSERKHFLLYLRIVVSCHHHLPQLTSISLYWHIFHFLFFLCAARSLNFSSRVCSPIAWIQHSRLTSAARKLFCMFSLNLHGAPHTRHTRRYFPHLHAGYSFKLQNE